MYRQKHQTNWIIIGIVFLCTTGCISLPPIQPPASANPPAITHTPSTEPTETITPFRTPTATFTLTASPSTRATSTPTPQPTLDLSTSTPQLLEKLISPNRNWTAITRREWIDGEERVILRVYVIEGLTEYIVENEPLVEIGFNDFIYPVPFYWSKDGKYLYFTHRLSGYDGCYVPGINSGFDFQRLDLVTGEVTLLVSSHGSYMAISPDEKYLAIIDSSEGMEIYNLLNGETHTLDLAVQPEDIGMEIDQRYIVWSPDSQSLVFTILSGICDGFSYYNWIVRVDLNPLKQTILIEKDDRDLAPISWHAQDGILTRDGKGNLWWMNPTTGGLAPVK